jgi:N-acetylmuramoyl-L-alanine amidase
MPLGLQVVYPPDQHQTTAAQIFFIGTAAPQWPVAVNGLVVERSPQGHFAPSFPLGLGENLFTFSHGSQRLQLRVTRIGDHPDPPENLALLNLQPNWPVARLPGELICLGAIAPAGAQVVVDLGNLQLPLRSTTGNARLPSSQAILTGRYQPQPGVRQHQGCFIAQNPGKIIPQFTANYAEQVVQQAGAAIEILSPANLEVVEITSDFATTRTGPGSNFSRLTPLPRGTRAGVTGRDGDWLRLDYGAWLRVTETRPLPDAPLPHSRIRGISSRRVAGATEVLFPLEVAVPLSIRQERHSLTLTLHNTTAQTDTIRLDDDPVIAGFSWQQYPGRVEYRWQFKSSQQWGYGLHYEGTTLVLSLRHPPVLGDRLAGVTILLDPGHGGSSDIGAVGPNGIAEKDINLTISRLLREHLTQLGATVVMTREDDREVSLGDRIALINQLRPTLALSIHYNALPDDGDALHTQGVGMFWYHPQSRDLAVFLHNYLVQKLGRPSYGIYWHNLALTRPHIAPAVLLELGFMINPLEFEWISDPQGQRELAATLSEAIATWLTRTAAAGSAFAN